MKDGLLLFATGHCHLAAVLVLLVLVLILILLILVLVTHDNSSKILFMR